MTAGLRWTPEEFAEIMRKRSTAPSVAPVTPAPKASAPKPSEAVKSLSAEETKVLRAHRSKERVQALGRLKAGEMNGTEKRYAQHLDERKRSGEIVWVRFEGMKFRLADNTFYTPDFMVMLSDGHIEAHEVKGHWQDDARVKIKIAADMYPFRFVAVQARPKKAGGGWSLEDFSA
jgi:hypothetical protein